ncbi:hypothetical protein ACFQMF_15590 [Halorubrum rutilum]|uniref:Uncharacterized protein n=1 Tax=Halorubrum rutilum TaxID=1364933 RepID=A0ABD6APB9_9EURY|nr:hypothetical protein [Halorubrum rutilum]
MLVTIKLERFPTRICELLIKSNPREDFLEILSRVLSTRFHAEFELWEQHRRRSTANLFRLSCLDHLLTNTAQHQEPQSDSATTVKGVAFSLHFHNNHIPVLNPTLIVACLKKNIFTLFM